MTCLCQLYENNLMSLTHFKDYIEKQLENNKYLPKPYISNSTKIDDNGIEEPQLGFTWPLENRLINIYITEHRILISDPHGRLFGVVYDINQLELAVKTVLDEIMFTLYGSCEKLE